MSNSSEEYKSGMQFSVVIPTANRFEKLLKVLKSLEEQTFASAQFEVIVVDDGSTDPLYEQFNGLANSFPGLRIKLLRQAASGAAAARNLGISHASGEYVLFLGDDTLADSNLLREHANTHRTGDKISVLGWVAWEQSLKMTPLMEFIAPYGPQFDFNIKNPLDCGYRRFYTSNISVPRKELLGERFNCSFPGCNWEDIDLGYRLEKKGMRIVHNPEAVVYHDHAYDQASFLRRQRSVGRNKNVLFKLHPELNDFRSHPVVLTVRLYAGKLVKLLGALAGKKALYYRGLFEEAWIDEFLKH